MRHLVREAGLEAQIEIDSAGTAGYHHGELPDRRARAAGARRGVEIGGRARQVVARDFERFDYVLAMDQSNLENLLAIAPQSARQRVRLLRSFDPEAPAGAAVPDPYYGDDSDFDAVFSICEAACRGLLAELARSSRS